jgi:hypothetical protein
MTMRNAGRPTSKKPASAASKDVPFVEPDDDVNDEIDAAYHAKYDRYSARYSDPRVGPEPRAATIRPVPR